MRCGTARRRISDSLDGALSRGRQALLEAHLESCPSCRAYRERAMRIQVEGRLRDDRSPASLAVFERALEARLDAAAGERPPVLPVPAGRRLVRARAWAAVAATLLIAAGAWYALGRRGTLAPVEPSSSYGDVLDPLLLAAEEDGDLAGRLEREVGSLIEATVQAPDTEALVLPAADPLFWEGLSEDDLRAIVSELEEHTSRGGPA